MQEKSQEQEKFEETDKKLTHALTTKNQSFQTIQEKKVKAKDIFGVEISKEMILQKTWENARLVMHHMETGELDNPFFLILPVGGLSYGALFLDCLGYLNSLRPEKLQLQYSYGILEASSYEGETSKDLSIQPGKKLYVGKRNVVVVDDLLDTGKTLKQVMDFLELERGALSVKAMVLLKKLKKRAYDVKLAYPAIEVEGSAFLLGEGLDWYGEGRQIKGVWNLVVESRPSEEKKKIIESIPDLDKQYREQKKALNQSIKISSALPLTFMPPQAKPRPETDEDIRDILKRSIAPGLTSSF